MPGPGFYPKASSSGFLNRREITINGMTEIPDSIEKGFAETLSKMINAFLHPLKILLAGPGGFDHHYLDPCFSGVDGAVGFRPCD